MFWRLPLAYRLRKATRKKLGELTFRDCVSVDFLAFYFDWSRVHRNLDEFKTNYNTKPSPVCFKGKIINQFSPLSCTREPDLRQAYGKPFIGPTRRQHWHSAWHYALLPLSRKESPDLRQRQQQLDQLAAARSRSECGPRRAVFT